MNSSKSMCAVFIVLVDLVIVAFLPGCDLRSYGDDAARPAEQPSSQPAAAEVLPANEADMTGWGAYVSDRFTFVAPSDWQVSVKQNDDPVAGGANYFIRLQNTSKTVVLSGAGPDNYYAEQNGDAAVNDGQYASSYIAITVDVYDGWGNKRWSEFFDQAYGGIVEDSTVYVVSARPELSAVVATRVSGIYTGSPRFFVRQGDVIFDFALFYLHEDKLYSETVFNGFINGFGF